MVVELSRFFHSKFTCKSWIGFERIHGTMCIFTYNEWLISVVNGGTYTIHGCYGKYCSKYCLNSWSSHVSISCSHSCGCSKLRPIIFVVQNGLPKIFSTEPAHVSRHSYEKMSMESWESKSSPFERRCWQCLITGQFGTMVIISWGEGRENGGGVPLGSQDGTEVTKVSTVYNIF